VEPSRYDAATAYLIVDGHQENNFDPWVYKTNDFGRTWKLIVNGLPKNPISYAHIIREDPVRRGLLYLGTEQAVYVSFDDGEHWQSLRLNMPPAPIYGMVIQQHFNDLVIGTYGRGFWILDDITPLQQVTAQVAAANVHLFPPRPAYRFAGRTVNYSMSDDQTAGQNPPYGAGINYWLRSAAQNAPTLAILDAAGKTVRTLQGTRAAGVNRVYWDLQNEPTKSVRLRTKPMYNPEFQMDADGTRSAPGFGSFSVRMPPGRYTVRLTVDGQSATQPLEVRRDPNVATTDQEIRAQVDLLLTMQTHQNAAADILNTIEAVRAQVGTLQALIANDRNNADLKPRADSLERKFIDLEWNLIDLRMTGQGQDGVRWPVRLGGQISYLAGNIAAGDFAPTAQQREVHGVLETRAREYKTTLETLVQRDLAAFNALLRQRGLRTIDVTMPAIVF
jgi:hypothetical protein